MSKLKLSTTISAISLTISLPEYIPQQSSKFFIHVLLTYSVTHTRLSSTDIDFIKHHPAHKYYDA